MPLNNWDEYDVPNKVTQLKPLTEQLYVGTFSEGRTECLPNRMRAKVGKTPFTSGISDLICECTYGVTPSKLLTIR